MFDQVVGAGDDLLQWISIAQHHPGPWEHLGTVPPSFKILQLQSKPKCLKAMERVGRLVAKSRKKMREGSRRRMNELALVKDKKAKVTIGETLRSDDKGCTWPRRSREKGRKGPSSPGAVFFLRCRQFSAAAPSSSWCLCSTSPCCLMPISQWRCHSSGSKDKQTLHKITLSGCPSHFPKQWHTSSIEWAWRCPLEPLPLWPPVTVALRPLPKMVVL